MRALAKLILNLAVPSGGPPSCLPPRVSLVSPNCGVAHIPCLVIALQILLALASALTCFAQPVAVPAPAALAGSGSAALALFRVVGALALVLTLFFVGLWVWRNWQRLVITKGRMPKLAVCEVKSLGARHTLYVIGYERQRMLVAASPTGITLLTALPPAAVAEEASQPEAGAIPNSSFGALLFQAATRKS